MDSDNVLSKKDYEEITEIVLKACSDLETSIKLIVRKELQMLEASSPLSPVRTTPRSGSKIAALYDSEKGKRESPPPLDVPRSEDQPSLQNRTLRGGNWMSGDLNQQSNQGNVLLQKSRIPMKKNSLRAGGWTASEIGQPIDKELSDHSVHSLQSLPGQALVDDDDDGLISEPLELEQTSSPVKTIKKTVTLDEEPVTKTIVSAFTQNGDHDKRESPVKAAPSIESCPNPTPALALAGRTSNNLQITGVVPLPRHEPPDILTSVSGVSAKSGKSELTAKSVDSKKPPEDILTCHWMRGYVSTKAYEYVHDHPPRSDGDWVVTPSSNSVKSLDHIIPQSSPSIRRRSRMSDDSTSIPAGLRHSEFARPHWRQQKSSLFIQNGSEIKNALRVNTSNRLSVQGAARKCVRYPGFDVAIGILLLINAFVMGAEVDWAARHIDRDVPIAFWFIQITLCACFVVEISMRILAHGLKYFYMPGYTWNIFDFTLVFVQVLEEIVSFILVNSGEAGDAEALSNASVLRVLRILRGLRILRFVRLLRLFSELRVLVISIGNSLRSFFWTLVLLFLIIYVVSVYFTQMSADQRRLGGSDQSSYENLEFYWGNLGLSMLSLFQSFSGGIDWDNAIRPMMDHVSPVMALFFSLYIALTTFVLLNLVTGIFVDSAAKNLREEQEVQLVNQIRELFIEGDQDHSGEISWEEFEAQLKRPQIDAFFQLLDLDKSEAWGFFNLLDFDGSGCISSEEFVMGCLRLRGMARAIDLATLMNETKKMFMWLNTKISRIDDGLRGLYMEHVPDLVVRTCD